MRLRRLLPLFTCLLLGACATAPQPRADAILLVGQVQGSGQRSPLEGRMVQVEGVVSADFRPGLGGFFLQGASDGDARTSDGVFVQADETLQVAVGDRLGVAGTVLELGGSGNQATLTTLEAERIEPLGRGSISRMVLDAPPADWEALEGMQVEISAPLTVSGSHSLGRFGEIVASFEGRLWQPSEVAQPGSARFAQVLADNDRRRLLLDDGSSARDPGEAWYLSGQPVPRSGSTLAATVGVVDQRHGQYRLQLTVPLQVKAAARPHPPVVDGAVRVAVFNLENLFNGDGRGGGFPTPRGARTPQELDTQRARLVATLLALDADIAAVMELENDGYGPESSGAQLVDALAASVPGWRLVDAGSDPGSDQIRVGLLYRADRVQRAGKPALLQGGAFARGSRVPQAQAFRRPGGAPFVVVANHFKSKGCSGAAGEQADQGDGQACWNPARVEAATQLHAWLQTDPTGTGTPLQLLVGDLNAYAMEDPLRTLARAGWVDALAGVATPPYTYVYEGQAGRLDHALLSPALAPRLAGAAVWHANADESDELGYANDDARTPWRSSDHDPIVIGLDL